MLELQTGTSYNAPFITMQDGAGINTIAPNNLTWQPVTKLTSNNWVNLNAKKNNQMTVTSRLFDILFIKLFECR